MKSSRGLSVIFALVLSLIYADTVQAQSVTRAKLAELSLHRLERLVILKKIEGTFQSKVQSLRLESIPHQTETEASFKSTILQYPGSDGTQKTLEVIMDEAGKAIKNTIAQGADAQGAFEWPDKDATTLCENALHYVQDNVLNKPELLQYDQKFSVFSLAQGTNSSGAIVAVVDIQAGPEVPILRVRMKVDGTFDSAEFIPRTE